MVSKTTFLSFLLCTRSWNWWTLMLALLSNLSASCSIWLEVISFLGFVKAGTELYKKDPKPSRRIKRPSPNPDSFPRFHLLAVTSTNEQRHSWSTSTLLKCIRPLQTPAGPSRWLQRRAACIQDRLPVLE
jgi:hypothetical protein